MTRWHVAAAAFPALLLAAQGRAQDIFWANPAGGNWNEPSNWSPANVPNAPGEFARIELEAVVVELVNPLSVGRLAITRPSSTLRITPNGRLGIVDHGNIVNQGLIHLRSESADFFTQLQLGNEGVEGEGTIRLDALGESHLAVRVQSSTEFRNHAGHTIAGAGQWNGALINAGIVRADAPGRMLQFTPGARGNSRQLAAVDQGLLRFESGTILQSGDGEIFAGAGGRVELAGVRIENGRLRTEGGIIRFTPGSSTLTTISGPQLTVDGHVQVVNLAEVTVRDSSLVNHGLIEINPENLSPNSRLRFTGASLELAGEGRISMRIGEGLESGAIVLFSGGVITHGAGHAITGSGWIDGGFVNRGLVRADREGEPLVLRPGAGSLVNVGEFRAAEGGTLSLDRSFSQRQGDASGRVVAGNASRVEIQGVEISRGRMESEGTGRFIVLSSGAHLVGLTLAGRLEFRAAGQLRLSDGAGEFINNGSIVINPEAADGSRTVFADKELRGEGELILIPGEGLPVTSTTLALMGEPRANGEHHTIAGSGQIRGDMTNHGRLSPGLPVGEIQHAGGFVQGSTGVLVFDIASGRAEHDRYLVDGSATLAGTARVRLLDGFEPAVGSRFVLLRSGVGVFGRFDVADLPAPSHEARWVIQYTASEVHAVLICPADFNGDGTPSIFDFLAFQTAFGLGDPAADYTGDGELNLFDYLAFQSAFGRGC